MGGFHYHNLKGRTYRPVEKVKVIERRKGNGGTYWRVEVNGVMYWCANEQGKAVRIAFQPRGFNRGFHWHGVVRDAKGKTIWSDRVNKSTGALSMLHSAGLITWTFEAKQLPAAERYAANNDPEANVSPTFKNLKGETLQDVVNGFIAPGDDQEQFPHTNSSRVDAASDWAQDGDI